MARFFGVQMRIRVPGLLYVGVAEAAGDLLDVDAVVDEQGGVAMAEVVDAKDRKLGGSGVLNIVIGERRIAEAVGTTADAVVHGKVRVGVLQGKVRFQDIEQDGGNADVAVRAFVLWRGLDDATAFDLLGDTASDMDDAGIQIYVRPFQRVQLTFAHPGIVCQDEEDVIAALGRAGAEGFCCVDIAEKLLRRVIMQHLRSGREIWIAEGADRVS